MRRSKFDRSTAAARANDVPGNPWLLPLALFASVLLATPLTAANHVQTENGKSVAFDHKTGNEWWVEVILSGPDAGSASKVEAMDTGGFWTNLPRHSWGAWGASFHIEPGHQVRFRATWPGGAQVTSCWFSHPVGAEQCGSTTPSPPPPPPPGGFDATFSNARGNEWWVEVDVSANQALGGVDARINCAGPWRVLTKQSWGSWAASFQVPNGATVDFRARSTSGAQDQSGGYIWPSAIPTSACGSTSPPPPPPPPPPPGASPDSREAEDFVTKTAGGRQTVPTASGGAVWNLWSNGYIEHPMNADGFTDITIVARGTPANGVWPTMVVRVDGAVAGTFTVASSTFQAYTLPPAPTGTRALRISFTNDLLTKTEDRNLILDVVTTARTIGAGPAPSFTLGPGESETLPFEWGGGPGWLMPHVATLATKNTKPTVTVALDGVPLGEARVEGPVPRPFLTAFNATDGAHNVTYQAINGTVSVSDLRVLAVRPPLHVTGAAARVHVGGAAEGTGWRFNDFGYLEAPLVVETTGWYHLSVQGVGKVDVVGPLVHLWLNRTVIAEETQGSTVHLQATRYLHAGIGYGLGASFEDPGATRSLRIDLLKAEPAAEPPPLPPPAPVSPLPVAAGWPQYGRDAFNSRSNPDPDLPDAASATAVSLLWRTPVDGSVTSTPAVVDGHVYVGTWKKSVYSLDEATGSVEWKATLPEPVDDSPAVARNVFIATGAPPSVRIVDLVIVGAKPHVIALNAATGGVEWQTTLDGHLWSSPIVDGDSVFVGVVAGTGRVVRLELATGDVIWDTPTTSILNGGARVWASTLVPPGSGLVVAGTSPGTLAGQPDTMDSLLAYDREDGGLVWKHQFFPLDTNDESSPAATVRQNRDISGTPHLAIVDGRPIVLASEKHGPTWAVDLADGRLVHGSRLLDARPAHVGSGGYVDGVEVVSSTEPDRVAGFDVRTGDLLWQQSLPATNFAPVAIGNGLVWIGSWEGHLNAYDLHTGEQVAALDAGGGVLGGASLANGHIYVGALAKPAGGGSFGDSLGKLPGSVSAWG